MMAFPQRQPVRQPKDNAIHVANLPPGASVEFIRSLFSECGTVINVILKNKPTGSYCFCEFADREEAVVWRAVIAFADDIMSYIIDGGV